SDRIGDLWHHGPDRLFYRRGRCRRQPVDRSRYGGDEHQEAGSECRAFHEPKLPGSLDTSHLLVKSRERSFSLFPPALSSAPMTRPHRLGFPVLSFCVVPACGGAGDRAVRPSDPTAADALGEKGCEDVSGSSEPLVVDWKPEERTQLELAM